MQTGFHTETVVSIKKKLVMIKNRMPFRKTASCFLLLCRGRACPGGSFAVGTPLTVDL